MRFEELKSPTAGAWPGLKAPTDSGNFETPPRSSRVSMLCPWINRLPLSKLNNPDPGVLFSYV